MEVKVNGIVHYFKAKRNGHAFCANEHQFGGKPVYLVGGDWKNWSPEENRE